MGHHYQELVNDVLTALRYYIKGHRGKIVSVSPMKLLRYSPELRGKYGTSAVTLSMINHVLMNHLHECIVEVRELSTKTLIIYDREKLVNFLNKYLNMDKNTS